MEALGQWQVPASSANQTVPIIFNLDQQHVIQTHQHHQQEVIAVETQTLPWETVLHMATQTYLNKKLGQLLDSRIRGNTCVHKKLMTLDDILAIVVERHNALCLREGTKTQQRKTTFTKDQQNEMEIAAIENFTETEAAALVMAELMSSGIVTPQDHHQQTRHRANNLHAFKEEHQYGADSSHGGNEQRAKKSSVFKRSAPGASWQHLKEKEVQIIRCDPPEHILQKEREAQQLGGSSVHGVTASGMRRHVAAKKWFQCPECDRKLEDVWKLRRHVTKHSTDRPFQCNQCPRTFKTNDAVMKHIRGTHEKAADNKKLFCQYCGRAFACRRTRDQHVRVHTGEKPFKCQESGCTFATNARNTMGKHMLRRHSIGDFTPCELCDCKWEGRHELIKHLASEHKAQFPRPLKDIMLYGCLICNVEFQECDDVMLIKHMVDTHGEESSTCQACVKKTRRHQRITEEAIVCGMDKEAARDIEKAQGWINEDKEKRRLEKIAKENEHFTKMAIIKGMNKDKAKNGEAAREWLKEKNDATKKYHALQYQMRQAKTVRESDLINSSAQMTLEELREDRIKSGMKESELENKIEELKKRVYKDAMDVALEIIEDIEAEEVLGREHRTQELEVVRAQLAIRHKDGMKQKSLVTVTAKKTIGLQTDAECGIKEKFPTAKDDGGRVIRFEEKEAYIAMKEPVRHSVDLLKKPQQMPKLDLTIYSQSPKITFEMLQRKEITFFIKYHKKHARPRASHFEVPSVPSPKAVVPSPKSSVPSAESIVLNFCKQIVITTAYPRIVQKQLSEGKLNMKIAPMADRKGIVKLEEKMKRAASAPTMQEEYQPIALRKTPRKRRYMTVSTLLGIKPKKPASVDAGKKTKAGKKRKMIATPPSSSGGEEEEMEEEEEDEQEDEEEEQEETVDENADEEDEWNPDEETYRSEKLMMDNDGGRSATRKSTRTRKTVIKKEYTDDVEDDDDADDDDDDEYKKSKMRSRRGGRSGGETMKKAMKLEVEDLEPGEIVRCWDVTGEETWKASTRKYKKKSKPKETTKPSLQPVLNIKKCNRLLYKIQPPVDDDDDDEIPGNLQDSTPPKSAFAVGNSNEKQTTKSKSSATVKGSDAAQDVAGPSAAVVPASGEISNLTNNKAPAAAAKQDDGDNCQDSSGTGETVLVLLPGGNAKEAVSIHGERDKADPGTSVPADEVSNTNSDVTHPGNSNEKVYSSPSISEVMRQLAEQVTQSRTTPPSAMAEPNTGAGAISVSLPAHVSHSTDDNTPSSGHGTSTAGGENSPGNDDDNTFVAVPFPTHISKAI